MTQRHLILKLGNINNLCVVLIIRLRMVILIMVDTWKTIVMVKLLTAIHFSQEAPRHFKYSFIMMTWRYAIHWVQKEVFTRSVR